MVETVRKKLDPEKTRTDILEAAFATFSGKGFSGASIGDIANASGVPKSLVLYHYGSKEQLWQACVEQRAGPMLAVLDRFITEGGSIEELLEGRIKLHESNPLLARMLAWASIDTVPLPTFIQQRRDALLGRLEKEGKAHKVLLALATIDGWFLYRALYRRLAGDELVDGLSHKRLLKTALVVAGEG